MSQRIEIVSSELIIVHDVVDYDQTPAKAVKGLKNNSLIATNFPQEKWNGGKSGVVEADIYVVRPQRWFSTEEGRQILVTEMTPALPAEIAALRKRETCQALWVSLKQELILNTL